MMSDLKGILLLIYRQHNFTGNNSFPDIILTIDKMNFNGFIMIILTIFIKKDISLIPGYFEPTDEWNKEFSNDRIWS